MKKKLIVVLTLLLVTSYVVLSYLGIFSALGGSFAKEYCSCFYVEKESDLSCKNYATLLLPLLWYENDQKKMTVKALGGLHSLRQANYMGAEHGCTLVK